MSKPCWEVADTTRSNKRRCVQTPKLVLPVSDAHNCPKGPLRLPQDSPALKMAAVQTLPKEVSKLGQEIKLFGKWDTQECVYCPFI